MADDKITQLAENTDPQTSDLAVIVDDPSGSPVTKKITLTNLLQLLNEINIRYVEIECFSMRDSEVCETGDGAGFFLVPPDLDGYNLVSVHGEVTSAGTTGTMDIQVRNETNGDVNMLSTVLQFDSGADGDDGNVAINGSNDDVSSGDRIWIDFDAVHTTPAGGCIVVLGLQKP